MTVNFTFLAKTQQWAAIGPVDEMKVGTLSVRRSDGAMKTETIIKLSRPFPGQDGRMLCYGFLSLLPRRVH